jgi:hypothetical protein
MFFPAAAAAVALSSDGGHSAALVQSTGEAHVLSSAEKKLLRQGGPFNHGHGDYAASSCQHKDDPSITTYFEEADVTGYDSRIRSVAPCRSDGVIKWNVHEVRFYSDDCHTPLTPEVMRSSGLTDIHSNANAAIDNDLQTAWQGKPDEDGVSGVWLSAHFNVSTNVQCVQFWQCTCIYSTQMAYLERQHHLVWNPVGSTLEVSWANWSTIKPHATSGWPWNWR